MEFLSSYWDIIKEIIVPIIMITLGVTLFSLNFYGVRCFRLNQMKEDIDSKKYGKKALISINYEKIESSFSLFYIFFSLPKKGTIYYQDDIFCNQIIIIKRWRRFYLIIFLIIIPLLIIGTFINETIMN